MSSSASLLTSPLMISIMQSRGCGRIILRAHQMSIFLIRRVSVILLSLPAQYLMMWMIRFCFAKSIFLSGDKTYCRHLKYAYQHKFGE